MLRLSLICSARPERPHFPADDAASATSLAKLKRFQIPAGTICLSSTLRRAQQTCEVLGILPHIEPALDEVDFGLWKGRTPEDILTAEPEEFTAWLADPDCAPPQGESLTQVAARMSALLERLATDGTARSVIAVTHPAPIQAAILSVLNAPLHAASRISVAPSSQTRFSFDGKRWSLCMGV